MPEWTAYLLLGAVAGVLAGLFGIGGGLVIVPSLLFIWHLHPGAVPAEVVLHVAIGTSLATIIPTAAASTWSHHRRGAVLWPVGLRLYPGIIAGAAAGAWVAAQLGTSVLRTLFASFLLVVSLRIALGGERAIGRVGRAPPLGPAAAGPAGAAIGLLSALVGIGGGSLTTPFLLARGIPIRRAVATSAACGLPIALTGAVGYALLGSTGGQETAGFVHWPAALVTAAGSVVTAPLGARLAHRLPALALRRLFAALLAGVAIRLLF